MLSVAMSGHPEPASEAAPHAASRSLPPAASVLARSRRLRHRAEALLAGDPQANIAELDLVLTDACATVHDLRRCERRIGRAISALVLEDADSAQLAGRASRLALENRDVRAAIEEVQGVIAWLVPHRRAWEQRRDG
jgi:hypothetical protein